MSLFHHPGVKRSAVGVLLFGGLALLSLGLFLHAYAPAPRRPAPAASSGYDPAPMDAALDPAKVRAELDTVAGFGSRFLGQPGFARAQAHIQEAFRRAGLEILSLPVDTAVPVTERRDLIGSDGKPLSGAAIYPFWPNHLQPMVTPPEGLRGELVRITDEVLRERASFTGCIAVLDLADAPRKFGLSWIRYAELGCRAVIVTHREGLEAIAWCKPGEVYDTMTANSPVNFVRLAAQPGVLDHLGETVTLHVRTGWRNVPHDVHVGILRGPRRNPEAVVVTACAEACSVLPDLAPGVLSATGPAVLLAALEGLLPYRDRLQRDVVFVSYGSRVMGHLPADALTACLGPAVTKQESRVAFERRLEADRAQAAAVQAAIGCFADEAFLRDSGATARGLGALRTEHRAALEEQVRYVLNTLVFERAEPQMRLRVSVESAGGAGQQGPAFAAYREAARAYDQALDAAGFAPAQLCARKGDFARENRVRERCLARLRELEEHHARRGAQLRGALALHRALRAYEGLSVFSPGMLPGEAGAAEGEAFTFAMDPQAEWSRYRQSPVMDGLIQSQLSAMALPAGARFHGLRAQNHHGWAAQQTAGLPLDAAAWSSKGYAAFALLDVDRKRSYEEVGSPVERPYMRDTRSISHSLRVYGRTLLALAFGQGRFEPPLKAVDALEYSGSVLVGNVGRSILPRYPMKHALIGHKGAGDSYKRPGFYVYPVFFADAYGGYDLPFCSARIVAPYSLTGYSPEAAGYGPQGLIERIKDEGASAQRQFKSMQLGWGADRKNVNIVLFRAAPVTLLDMINPQSLKPYAAAGFLTREGLAPPDKVNVFDASLDGIWTAFLEPDRRFFITLKAGAVENERVQTTRAFVLGVDEGFRPAPDRDIDGRGFLPLTDTLITDLPERTARSMLQVNGRRLALQARYHMADERTRRFQEQSAEVLRELRGGAKPARQRTLLAREAATYATLNHPVLRESIAEAVLGVLWYLGLLVPFVFFFEKLVFGFPDIRKQLAAQAAIFVVVFALLQWLHPAFRMIRSSLMILLGFVILLVAGAMTVLFAGKFRDNLEELKKRRGQVAAAEVNALGVVGTAFSLGLNNMHRRAVRTGLTCATLVLITFALICFTSVQTDVVETERPVGAAPYQGLLVKPEKFAPITPAEVLALESRYGDRFAVAARTMVLGRQEADRVPYNPGLELVYQPAEGPARVAAAGSVLGFEPQEPLRGRIRLLTSRGWFGEGDPAEVMLSDAMAEQLGIRPSQVDREDVRVTLNGDPVRVRGVFDSESLQGVRDLDGRDLLPFDLTALRTVEGADPGVPLADEGAPRIAAERVVLAHGLQVAAEHGSQRTTSAAVVMPGLRYEAARSEVDRYLEQTGKPSFYALGDLACWGQRVRARTVAGVMELLVPLLIAAMTVLNTMRGSVYERREEIFVYNAVGIAPRYIFWMFLSEALVYAVVGSVLGYLLSQGTGRLLTALDLTGGLNMTFTSSATIQTSLALMAAVLLSTLFPARAALRIAAPADEIGWTLPEPVEDRLAFALPFTFSARDRMALLAFFNRFFLDHGEGSAGGFFASEPVLGVSEEPDGLAGGAAVPGLSATVWLRPFDLGVSQRLTLRLPTDPDTREFVARIELARESGTREAWVRLNRSFVAVLRRHFLYWRAVGPEDRRRLFDEAQRLLEGSPHHGG